MTEHPSNTQSESPAVASLEYTHCLEDWLKRPWLRRLLGYVSRNRSGTAKPHLQRALETYGDAGAPAHERLAYWPIHRAIDRLSGSVSRETLRERLCDHAPTIRGIVSTSRSVAHFGLTIPQKWLYPLFVVWNFTNRCNLKCRHCYQSSDSRGSSGELSLSEKLSLIDELGTNYVAMVAFAGGEPTLSRDLEPALSRCQSYGMHTTLATHGGLMSPERCKRLAGLGLKYVEISLDSIDPARHDSFRQTPGAWKRSVEGLKNVISTDGLRGGLAMCVHRDNLDEVASMLEFACDLGVSCFAHFNFIPVGRGVEMADMDISPAQREDLLELLRSWMQSKRIGVISTAPQFGRICLSRPQEDALISCSHAGNASGEKARVVAKYLGGCGAGRTYACVQPNGEVTPCVYMPDRIMGNIRRGSFRDIFQQSPWWDLLCDRNARDGACKECEYRNYCGGCRARADAYFHRLDQADPGCIKNLDAWRKIIQNGGSETDSPSTDRADTAPLSGVLK